MNKVKRVKNANYTTISNVFLRDKNLSLKAKGLLAMVFALPDDWDFSINGLCAIIKEGRTAIYSAIDELKEFGYCYVDITRNEKGNITGNDYTFFEQPNAQQPNSENPHTENPHAVNQLQLNKDNNKVLNETNNEKEIKEYKEKFKAFVLLYKKLTGRATRSATTEFEDFKKRHSDWKEVIPLLPYAIERETREREEAKSRKVFFPEPKMLQTYLGKQRAWEMYVNADDKPEDLERTYKPYTDGAIRWNEKRNCYIYVNMFFGFIPDGYEDSERPDGARIMLNNSCEFIQWNAETKKWEKTK